MPLPPWYKVVIPRAEVREGRSFNPDEFAIDLAQVVAGTAPKDYRDPVQFFARTCFTRALREHGGMVLRRLAGQTANTTPVMTLVTQFGGGKTHTLNALYHLATSGDKAGENDGVRELLVDAGLAQAPAAKVAVFVGAAWDPRENNETPWIDLARQLAGDAGVRALGADARQTPPGTAALGRVFAEAGGPVLVLFDEVLNFMNRHSKLADRFHAFIQNLTVAMTATTRGVAVISLPRSAVEMADGDMQWQEKITKVVKRVAKDLIANDEGEIGEVVRRRLFDSIGDERTRNRVSKTYADWCFEHRNELPSEWTAMDSANKEKKARDFLRERFAACYPFHPAALAVFQRKWQALAQYQRTRGTLAMLAQWIAWAYQDGFNGARKEPLITLGSAPLGVPEFLGVVLGQLGESRLNAAIDTDIAGDRAHARVLDADTQGALRDIHRRVGTTILFESSGGQAEKVAHLPELRFALGEPEVDTTSVDNAALLLEDKSYFIRKVGSDGFRIGYQPTLKKVVNDRLASLDEESEIKPAMEAVVKKAFDNGRGDVPLAAFPKDGAAIEDNPRLTLVAVSPETEWDQSARLRERLRDWTIRRGQSPRLYPGALVWCLKKPGRELRRKVEQLPAWKRVTQEVKDGILGREFTPEDHNELRSKTQGAKDAATEEVWASYRYAILYQKQAPDKLKIIDLGVGHSSSSETLRGRVVAALRSQGLLEESVGAGYLGRNWPDAFRESGAWPLDGLRKSFVDGSLIRLKDPDRILRGKIPELVARGEFGLGSGAKDGGGYERLWYAEHLDPAEVDFAADVFLLTREKVSALREKPGGDKAPPATPYPPGDSGEGVLPPVKTDEPAGGTKAIRLRGEVPPETWNKLGITIIPKLRQGDNQIFAIDLRARVSAAAAGNLTKELQRALDELGLGERVRVEEPDS